MKIKDVKDFVILDFPSVRQSCNYTCSCSVTLACLYFYGVNLREGQVKRLMGIDKNTQEIHPIKIVRVLRHFELQAKIKRLTLNDLIRYIKMGRPVICNLQAWSAAKVPNYNTDKNGHYAIAIGMDFNRKRIIFSDPSHFLKTFLSFSELEARWHDGDPNKKNDYTHMSIVVGGKRKSYRSDKIIHMD